MYNIWGFLLQTTSVSIVVLLILFLKHIFKDKLSPRWQYSIWILLAVRILIPVNLKRYIIPEVALGIEILKGVLEELLSSNFTQVHKPIQLYHIVPFISQVPKSITDWLFVIYILGVIICLLKYWTSYIHLRILLRTAQPVSESIKEKMLKVCETYDLRSCKMVTLSGISSAFICGVIRPVLVVPAQHDIDEKILLHELLHLKHYDTIQNIVWCLLRSFHWCNPLVQYAVNQLENDMESLCDQRVLESLEGEERREYGVILLQMASEKYARIPGTSSISNGSKHISERIEAIVRFKKYPQGMALVSVCIILILFSPTIIGSAQTFTKSDYENYTGNYHNVMAVARINRCQTIAGALDTYVKGLYLYNGSYIASASSFSQHERIQEELEEYGCYQSGKYIVNIDFLNDYIIYNLDQKREDEYTATICLDVSMFVNETTPELLENTNLEEYDMCDAYIFIPVSIRYEDAWVVEECGERYILSEQDALAKDTFIICSKEYYGKNDVGEMKMEIETSYRVDNSVQNDIFTMFSNFDTHPKTDAEFNNYRVHKYVVFTPFGNEKPRSYVELTIKEIDTSDYFENEGSDFFIEAHSEDGWSIFEGTTNWDGKVEDYAGGGYGTSKIEIYDMSSKYNVDILIGGVEMEDIILTEVVK